MRNWMFLFVGFASFVSLGSYSQQKYSLKGVVVEKGTENPVKDMSIFIPYSVIGTTSSSDGTFILSNIPKGKHEIHFRHLAYDE